MVSFIVPAVRSTLLRSPIASSSRSTLQPSLRNTLSSTRALSISSPSYKGKAPTFSRPGPPSLSPAEQKEFEALQAAANTASATPSKSMPSDKLRQINQVDLEQHRDMRKGPRKEFEGEVNPKTGESGGPKFDPFKAGDGDWTSDSEWSRC
jgi:hypothetical protein